MKKRIVFVLALVFALGLFGCSNGKPKVWEWTQSLSQEDIISVTPWRHDAERKEFEPLSDEETLEIVTLLNELTKDNFTHNKHLRGGTPIYGIKIVIASETYYLNQANGPHGSLEIEYNGKLWWIDNAELSDFVQNVTDSKPVKDEQPYSEPVGAPPAEHFSTVQEVVEHIKAVKAAGVEETVSSNHVVLYDKEYIYALKESPLPDYQHEIVALIIEGINIRYLADEHLSEDQVNFWWFKEYTDENVENLTRRYNLKQYKDTKFFFGQQHDDRVIYWWENGNQFSFHYPAETGINHVDIIDHLVVEKYDVDIEAPNFFAYDESLEAYLVQHQFAEETGDLLTAKTPIAMTEEETQILLDLLEPYADTLDGDVLKCDYLRYYSIEIDDRMTLTIDPELGNYGENGDSYMFMMEHYPGAYIKGTYIDAELVEFLRNRLAEEG